MVSFRLIFDSTINYSLWKGNLSIFGLHYCYLFSRIVHWKSQSMRFLWYLAINLVESISINHFQVGWVRTTWIWGSCTALQLKNKTVLTCGWNYAENRQRIMHFLFEALLFLKLNRKYWNLSSVLTAMSNKDSPRTLERPSEDDEHKLLLELS